MAKSLFFNAVPNTSYPTGYDRNYNADDISDWLGVVWENGVVKDGLKVEAISGMNIKVNLGRAAIKGKAFINNSLANFTVPTAPTSGTRYDYIVLRYDNNVSVRDITLQYKTGTTSIPTVSSLNRSGNVYELMLCYIAVGTSVSSITQANITDTRDNVNLCGWFTAVKGYDDYYDAIIEPHEDTVTMATTGRVVITGLAASLYNNNYSIIEVYTNGIKEQDNAYTISTSGGYIVITFTSNKTAGAKITVSLGNFIDGEGMSNALTQYTTLLADVAELKEANEYNYICNGVNDNILLGNVVRAFLTGGTDRGSAKINVIGNIGIAAAAGGDGSTASPYYWFNFNAGSNRKVIVDFSSAGQIAPTIANGTSNLIFHSNNDIDVIGANIVASNKAVNTIIRVISTAYGTVYFEKCRFYIEGYKDSVISTRGTFTNCRGTVSNEINNSYCFLNNAASIIKINGGEYYAYAKDPNVQSSIVGQSGTTAITILYGVNCPTVSKVGYIQTNCILQWANGGMLNCTDIISSLPMIVVSGISNIRGTISMSKPNAM